MPLVDTDHKDILDAFDAMFRGIAVYESARAAAKLEPNRPFYPRFFTPYNCRIDYLFLRKWRGCRWKSRPWCWKV